MLSLSVFSEVFQLVFASEGSEPKELLGQYEGHNGKMKQLFFFGTEGCL